MRAPPRQQRRRPRAWRGNPQYTLTLVHNRTLVHPNLSTHPNPSARRNPSHTHPNQVIRISSTDTAESLSRARRQPSPSP